MTSRVAVALMFVIVSVLTATPTWAQVERRAPLVSAQDPAGDVAVRDVDGLTDRQRRSVDLLDFKVVPRDEVVRFTFRIARVTTSSQFDQLLELKFIDADPGLPDVSGGLSLRVQDPRSGRADGTAETENVASGAGCLGVPVVVLRAAGLVKVDIDRTCLPPGQLDIALRSFTTTPSGERRTIYSRDFLKVPGSHDLGGLIGSEPR